jgi:hypothetical protein
LNPNEKLGDDLYTLWLRYPRCFLVGHISDPYFLRPPVTGGELISLGCLQFPERFTGLNKLQLKFLQSPFCLPSYPTLDPLFSSPDRSQKTKNVHLHDHSPLPRRYSSAEIIYGDDPDHPEIVAALKFESSDEEEEVPGNSVLTPSEEHLQAPPGFWSTPPRPTDPSESGGRGRDGIGYYQSFGEGLTINLELPIIPCECPLPPSDDE